MEGSLSNENTMKDNYTEDQEPRNPSSMPLISGIFLIIAGLLGLLTWSMALSFDSSMLQNVLPADSPISIDQLQSLLLTCGIIGCILSVFTLTGGIVALKRKAWGLAVIGGILGVFTIGPVFIGSIVSLIGLILVIISKKEFK